MLTFGDSQYAPNGFIANTFFPGQKDRRMRKEIIQDSQQRNDMANANASQSLYAMMQAGEGYKNGGALYAKNGAVTDPDKSVNEPISTITTHGGGEIIVDAKNSKDLMAIAQRGDFETAGRKFYETVKGYMARDGVKDITSAKDGAVIKKQGNETFKYKSKEAMQKAEKQKQSDIHSEASFKYLEANKEYNKYKKGYGSKPSPDQQKHLDKLKSNVDEATRHWKATGANSDVFHGKDASVKVEKKGGLPVDFDFLGKGNNTNVSSNKGSEKKPAVAATSTPKSIVQKSAAVAKPITKNSVIAKTTPAAASASSTTPTSSQQTSAANTTEAASAQNTQGSTTPNASATTSSSPQKSFADIVKETDGIEQNQLDFPIGEHNDEIPGTPNRKPEGADSSRSINADQNSLNKMIEDAYNQNNKNNNYKSLINAGVLAKNLSNQFTAPPVRESNNFIPSFMDWEVVKQQGDDEIAGSSAKARKELEIAGAPQLNVGVMANEMQAKKLNRDAVTSGRQQMQNSNTAGLMETVNSNKDIDYQNQLSIFEKASAFNQAKNQAIGQAAMNESNILDARNRNVFAKANNKIGINSMYQNAEIQGALNDFISGKGSDRLRNLGYNVDGNVFG